MPAWLPVNERASCPMPLIAIASRAIEMRSPAVSSMSSSRGAGCSQTASARSMSSSVVSPIALTTTTTSLPASRVSTMRLATRLMLAASATDDPPNFCTINAIGTPQNFGRRTPDVLAYRHAHSLRCEALSRSSPHASRQAVRRLFFDPQMPGRVSLRRRIRGRHRQGGPMRAVRRER